MEKGWFVGVDLGQSQDFTAVAAVERVAEQGEWDGVQFGFPKYWTLRLRHLERMELGTPYPAMVRRVCEIVRSGDLAGRCHLVVDATGVGRPVVDLLREARPGCRILPVTITGGDAESVEGGYYRTPKRDLVTGVQVLLQRGGLRIAAGLAEGSTLSKEMSEMRVKYTASGNVQYGAWREGTHDDLVLAVALACWGARKVYPRGPYGTG